MQLTVHVERYAIVRLDPDAEVPAWATTGPVSSVTRTESELSIVCREDVVPDGSRAERGWRVHDLERASAALREAGHGVAAP